MVRWLAILVWTLRSTIRTQRELALENLALRQQVAVWKVRQPRPQLTATDRLFWVVLSRPWTNWRSSLQVVQPETVARSVLSARATSCAAGRPEHRRARRVAIATTSTI